MTIADLERKIAALTLRVRFIRGLWAGETTWPEGVVSVPVSF